MERTLEFREAIISGDFVRDVIKVFPEVKDRFRQRKTYDEYYFDGATVELTLYKISMLHDLHLGTYITLDIVILD